VEEQPVVTETKQSAIRSALRMRETGPPRDLIGPAQIDVSDVVAADLTEMIEAADAADSFLNRLGMQIHKWDAALPGEEWTDRTSASSVERRALIYTRLGIDAKGAALLSEKRPIYHDETVVITAPWEDWYTLDVADDRAFYWPHYRDYLLETRGLPEKSVASLDLATTDVVRRLANPTANTRHQAKGLVVGYVQSGKTANFTGVVAKAIDAGYRLVIVMTGTIEMLRAQTQRRMDMDLVGRQNIVGDLSPEQAIRARVDYQDDDAWLGGRFADFSNSEMVTEIHRLTQHHKDYQRQFRTLKLDRFDGSRPLYDPVNLFRSAARLAIVKKNATVLGKLVDDIEANRTAFEEIPVLIIDDESDQASVNTVDPEKIRAAKREGKEIKERRAINERIASMLRLMPRAQYVGYTATPFANVFVDPSDDEGIFPKDFVISLSRPDDYMGVDDFHDFGRSDDEGETDGPNERAHVRHLKATDDELELQDEELRRALDTFVLTGAVKLYRLSVDPSLESDYRHHTMLVHNSVTKADHREISERIRDLWDSAGFASPSGKQRLKSLYEDDLLPVSADRVEDGIPRAPMFEELASFVSASLARITEHSNNPVIVVNSDKDVQRQQQILDFDRYSTWRILVGGAKLSRGFTVEGLTVTYFRRATKMADSLTQMGRWFGFRRGYRDLVRLFIARSARFGSKDIDLYGAFEGIALDEADFREQLKMYAEWEDGKPRLVPAEIPPLVTQHLPWLAPTAGNKMFNAVLEEQSEQPFTPAGYPDQLDSLKANLDRWRPILKRAETKKLLPEKGRKTTFEACLGIESALSLVDVIDQSVYLPLYGVRSIVPKTAFYRRLISEGELEDFLIVVPQPATRPASIDGVGSRTAVSRKRRTGRGGKFGEITEPKYRWVAEQFANGTPDESMRDFYTPTRGLMLLYVVREAEANYEPSAVVPVFAKGEEPGLIAAFSAYLPNSSLTRNPRVLKFRVHDPSKRDSPTIEAESSAS
jgi:Z1 domain